MSNEIPEEKWKAEHAIFREQIPGYSRSGFSFFQGEMFYLAGRNAGQAEIELYSNAFKAADELRISSAERYDKEIQKRDELLNTALKHLDMAYKWGLWLYESEDYQEMEDDDEKDNMKSDLNIVCSFLNTNKVCER